MDKITVLAIAAAIVLVAGAVFAAADFLDEDVPAAEEDSGSAAEPKACGNGNDCGAGCGGQCGGSCGVPRCGCGR